ncbi:camphor resistance protein CrcB [[Leptolyngbya] sp. PCC 7376]|uniref:fluoride efflux transporter CrcB n=1 Tax=[Leptolyngbya] sp. PCC 7376 TaxID=111781 RepID=UPI00029F3A13|nr:fluoride efflux transporter CrcB [[Leptolyngbya] sp. PCC 7376]AFY36866.1 camphor resistance protein CrcB [[Leptolyngbya] sp. PCC 7376]
MDWIPLIVAYGAVFGALSRYYISLFWIQKQGSQYPYGTLFVNLTGALIIGIFAALAAAYELPIVIQKFILVGFLGAYTTFSSYIFDSANLFRSDRLAVAFLYWLGSPILGFVCVELGIFLGRYWL